jgi:hypothetical protein
LECGGKRSATPLWIFSLQHISRLDQKQYATAIAANHRIGVR